MKSFALSAALGVAILAGLPAGVAFGQPAAQSERIVSGADRIRADAELLRPFFKSAAVKAFLDATAALPSISDREVLESPPPRKWYSKAQAEKLAEADRAKLVTRSIDENYYYNTRYGTPLAYCRAIELLATAPGASPAFTSFERAKIADYGYGNIGQLRLWASLGAETVGIDVDPRLALVYSDPTDTGRIANIKAGAPDGTISLVTGLYPGNSDVRAAVGGGFDLFISKNTLKKGYIHPSEPVDKAMLVDLSTTDEEFLRTVHESLKPGGFFVIYNICPAPSKPGEKYKPWADGLCPFDRSVMEKAGFKVLLFDQVDNAPVREMARALKWDTEMKMDLENDTFAWCTIAQKPK